MTAHIKLKALHPNVRMPEKKTPGAAAYDIYMPEAGNLLPGRWLTVPLGFAIEIPPGYAAELLPRSGAGRDLGLRLRNTTGLIDSDYREEVKAAIEFVGATNLTSWRAGDRLLQLRIVPVVPSTMTWAEDLDKTERTGGFGSTGVA